MSKVFFFGMLILVSSTWVTTEHPISYLAFLPWLSVHSRKVIFVLLDVMLVYLEPKEWLAWLNKCGLYGCFNIGTSRVPSVWQANKKISKNVCKWAYLSNRDSAHREGRGVRLVPAFLY